ncbi:UNVERIFIED_CONTAM: hypothetical protein GTU68_054313 [Idotea baltica]|nr:hypothetical protein [Idotea baltica]
MCVLSASSPS